MKKVYKSVESLDKRCYEKYGLSEDILQEHAALGIYEHIKTLKNKKSLLVVCGGGNNGADGMALARLADEEYDVTLVVLSEPKTHMAKVQLQRAISLGTNIKNTIDSKEYDIVVDAIFGSGLNKELSPFYLDIIDTLNSIDAYKIACDIPSGLGLGKAFIANTTVTMGGLKLSLFMDDAKDIIGDVIVANLGLNSKYYEEESDCLLLESSDLILPFRNKLSTHKGNFGHLLVVAGEKIGAGILASEAGFMMGAGLVSIMTHDDKLPLPPHIMHTHHIPHNLTAVAIGMGLGNFEEDEIRHILSLDISKVCDADLFYSRLILEVLNDTKCVLTPHPKEFVSLLKICGIDDISVSSLQNNRFFYLEKFCKTYPNVTLLLKGANILIGKGDKIYINPLGSSVLSQGGSGDVLSGFIGSYLAQSFDGLQSAIYGSLALTLSAKNYKYNNYSLKPQDLIQGVKEL